VVFEQCKSEIDKDVLIKACAWMVLKPGEGRAITRVPELGWDDENDEERCASGHRLCQEAIGAAGGKLPKKD